MKLSRELHILVILLFICSSAGLFGQSARMSHSPGEYNQTVLLAIEGASDTDLYYRFSGSTSDHFIPYKFPLRLSALSGEERLYRIELSNKEVPGDNDTPEVFEYVIDKRKPEQPVPMPEPGFYSEAVGISFRMQDDAVFYSLDKSISDSPQLWDGDEIILRERKAPYQIYAYARDSAGNLSTLGQWEYLIGPKQADPVDSFEILSPAEGVFRNKQLLYVRSSSLSEFLYTTDGSDPRTSGKSFSQAVMLDVQGDVLLSVAAKLPDGRYSAVKTRRFTVQNQGQFPNIPESGVYRNEKIVNFKGNPVFYTFEERIPTTDDSIADDTLTLAALPGTQNFYSLRFVPQDSENQEGHYRYFYSIDSRKPEAPLIHVSGTAPYSTAPLISMLDQGPGRIHYTLDARDPDASSPLYDGPFVPPLPGDEGNLMIKAVIVTADGVAGSVAGRLIPYDTLPPSPPEITVAEQDMNGMCLINVQTTGDSVAVYETGADEETTRELSEKSPLWTGEKLSVPWGMSTRRFFRFASRDSAGNLSSPQTLWIEIHRLPPPAPVISNANEELSLSGSGRMFYSLADGTAEKEDYTDFVPYEEPVYLSGVDAKRTVYRIRAFSEDEWGNRSSIAEKDYSVDLRLPELPGITGLEDRRVYNSPSLKPRFSSDNEDLDVVYSLGTDSLEPPDPDINSPSLKDLSIETEEGREVYYHLKMLPVFREKGRAGRITSFRFVVDRKAPDIPEVLGIPSGGVTAEDFVLSLGKLSEDETAYLLIGDDPDSLAGKDPVIHGEKYTGPRRVSLAEGFDKTFVIKLSLLDSAGNRSNLESDLHVHIDRKAPVEPVCTGIPENGVSGTPVTLGFQAVENAGIEYRLLTETSIPRVGEIPFTVYTEPVELSGEDGALTTFQIEYRSFDEAGNRSLTTRREIISIDRRSVPDIDEPLVMFPGSRGLAQLSWDVPAGSTLHYRLSGSSAWSVYTAPVAVDTSAANHEVSVQYYLQNESGRSSPVRSVSLQALSGAPGTDMVRGVDSGGVYPGQVILEPVLASDNGCIRYELGINAEAPELGPSSPLMEGKLVLDVPTGMERVFSLRVGLYPSKESRVAQMEEYRQFTIDRLAPRSPQLREGSAGAEVSRKKTLEFDGDGGRILYSLDGAEPNTEYTGVILLDGQGEAGSRVHIRAAALDGAGNRSRTAEWTVLLDQDIVYVSEKGNDLYEGTRERPFRSLAKALEQAQALGRGTLYVAEGSYQVQRPLVINSKLELIGGLDTEDWKPAGRSTIYPGEFFPAGKEIVSVQADCSMQGLLFSDVNQRTVLPVAVRNAEVQLKDIDTASESSFDYLLRQEGGLVTLTDTAVYRGGRQGIFLNLGGSLNIKESTLTVTDNPAGDWSAIRVKDGNLSLISSTVRPGNGSRTASVDGENGTISLQETELFSGSGRRSATALRLVGGQTTIAGGSIHAEGAQTPIAVRAEDSRLDIQQLKIILGGYSGNTGLMLENSELRMLNCDITSEAEAGFSFMLRQKGGSSDLLNCTAMLAAQGEQVLVDLEGGRFNMVHSSLLASSLQENPSGILTRSGAGLYLTNCIISNNGRPSGTVLTGEKDDVWSISNCVFGGWYRTAEYGGRQLPDPTALNSLDGEPLGGWIDGNLNESPEQSFSDAAYHLRETSACVDAGTESAAGLLDLDGQKRPNPGHGIKPFPDIGADEFYSGNP